MVAAGGGYDGDLMSRFRKWIEHRLGGHSIGRRGERLAARYLRRQGLRIVGRNLRCGRGEIDIVALEGETLVFVEVKSRSQRSWHQGMERIDRAKLRALRRACRFYLSSIGWRAEAYRIDAVLVDFEIRGWFPRLRDIRWHRGILDLDGS